MGGNHLRFWDFMEEKLLLHTEHVPRGLYCKTIIIRRWFWINLFLLLSVFAANIWKWPTQGPVFRLTSYFVIRHIWVKNLFSEDCSNTKNSISVDVYDVNDVSLVCDKIQIHVKQRKFFHQNVHAYNMSEMNRPLFPWQVFACIIYVTVNYITTTCWKRVFWYKRTFLPFVIYHLSGLFMTLMMGAHLGPI